MHGIRIFGNGAGLWAQWARIRNVVRVELVFLLDKEITRQCSTAQLDRNAHWAGTSQLSAPKSRLEGACQSTEL